MPFRIRCTIRLPNLQNQADDMNDDPMARFSVRNLEQIQRWLQTVITHPHGVTAGVASDEARTQIDVTPDTLEEVVTRSQCLSSFERVGIYANAYYSRLLECLREDFPALTQALGEETFNAFAFGYLQQYPSESYTLANLSSRFPQYLAETRPDDEEQEEFPSWADFLIDLATLEQTYNEIFDGPGIEDARLLQPEDLNGIPPERWPDARLIPAPCLRLLRLNYPVHEFASAVRKAQSPTVPQPGPTFLVIMRRDYLIHRHTVTRNEYRLLQAFVDGRTVGDALAELADEPESDPDQLAENMSEWFHSWARLALFTRVELASQSDFSSD